jgi:histidinol phosphatase-like PHP family hydrolase
MRYVFDNDLHIHSQLSSCSGDAEQTTDAILAYAKENGLTTICLTDHYWDEQVPSKAADCGWFSWYAKQDTAHIREALPLPQCEGIRFLFGCEAELDRYLTLGLSLTAFDMFDFVAISTTHLHMQQFTCRGDEDKAERAELYRRRLEAVLDLDLPFHKIGISHLTCGQIYTDHHTEVLDCITDEQFRTLFAKAAARGVGIELNFNGAALKAPERAAERESVLRPYRIAKAEGCKFYFGSDAHHPAHLASEKKKAEAIIDLLELTEEDKFRVG